jgi:hypothetical protein
MGISDSDHSRQYVVPGLGLHHDFIGKHTSIPAHVATGFRQISVLVTKPVAGHLNHLYLSVGIGGKAMTTSLIV